MLNPLLQAVNKAINRLVFEADLERWGKRKEECDRHNAAIRSRNTHQYDPFSAQRIRDPGPPPRAGDYMGRTLGCPVILALFCTLGALLFYRTFL